LTSVVIPALLPQHAIEIVMWRSMTMTPKSESWSHGIVEKLMCTAKGRSSVSVVRLPINVG